MYRLIRHGVKLVLLDPSVYDYIELGSEVGLRAPFPFSRRLFAGPAVASTKSWRGPDTTAGL